MTLKISNKTTILLLPTGYVNEHLLHEKEVPKECFFDWMSIKITLTLNVRLIFEKISANPKK